MTLVPVFEHRPPFITVPGTMVSAHWRDRLSILHHGPVQVCISVHDTYHLKTKAAFRRIIKALARRSRLGTTWIERYRVWLKAEKRWYAALNLDPPEWRLLPRGEITPLHAREARPTHCPKGHTYNDANTRVRNRGTHTSRDCRVCQRMRRAA